eukprot:61967_1
MASLFLFQILLTIDLIQSQTQNTSTTLNSSIPAPINSNHSSNNSIWNSLISTEVPLFVLILALLIGIFCCCICFLCYMNLSYKRKKHPISTTTLRQESIGSNSKSDENDKDIVSLKSPRSVKSDFEVVKDMEIELETTKGSKHNIEINTNCPAQNTVITKQFSISSTVYGVDGHEIKSPQLRHGHDSPSTVRIQKKSPSTIFIKHYANNKQNRRSSNRLQVANKSVFDSPDIKLSTLPNDNLIQSYDNSLMALDGSILRGTYESEGQYIINRLGTDSFSKIRTLKKDSEGNLKHTKGKSIIDQISGDLQSDMPGLAEDEFEVVGTPSVDVNSIIHTKK